MKFEFTADKITAGKVNIDGGVKISCDTGSYSKEQVMEIYALQFEEPRNWRVTIDEIEMSLEESQDDGQPQE